jgi:hypothetical protein
MASSQYQAVGRQPAMGQLNQGRVSSVRLRPCGSLLIKGGKNDRFEAQLLLLEKFANSTVNVEEPDLYETPTSRQYAA